MKNNHRRGQFVLISALILAIIIISLAVTVHFSLTENQRYNYEDSKEIMDNLGTDYKNALTNILASATQEYNFTADLGPPRTHAFGNFSFWTQSALQSFSSIGVETQFSLKNTTLQPSKNLYGNNIRQLYAGNLMKLYWYMPTAISSIYGSASANISRYGFYGWETDVLVMLNLTVAVPSIQNNGGYTTVNIYVSRENSEPINNLTPQNLRVDYFDSSLKQWTSAIIENLVNNGGGNYTIYMTDYSGSNTIPAPLNKYLVVWCQDSRGILAEAYTYTHVTYVIQENAVNQFLPNPTTTAKPSEVYDFESINNGSILWFGQPLKFANQPAIPLPIPPVKQFRVDVTTNGPGSANTTTPSQVEIWTKNYTLPTLNFANWRTRFELGDKLVYDVGFGPIGVTKQVVTIYWLNDADASPPTYLISTNSSSQFVDVTTNMYTIRLLANQAYSLSIDWSVSMRFNGYHIEDELNGIGYIPFSGGYWEPALLPGGVWTANSSTSFVIIGPVRGVAFRKTSTETAFYNTGGSNFAETQQPGPYQHTDIILIPYGVPYAHLYETYNFTSSYTGYQYYNLINLIAGVSGSGDYGQRPTNYASLTAGGVSGGAYTGSTNSPTTSISYWFTEYNAAMGEAVIGSDNFPSTIKQLFPGHYRLWAWNSGDDRRTVFMAMEQAWNYSNTTLNSMIIPKGSVLNYKAALWTYNGYDVSGSANLANLPPNIYYRMFQSPYFPTIIAVSSS